MKNLILIILLLSSSSLMSQVKKQFSDVSLNEIINETQAQPNNGDDNHISLVWWVPYEYWATVFHRDATISKKIRDDMLESLNGYSLIAIVQADISAFGAFDFYSKDEVMKNLKVELTKSNKVKQLNPSMNISSDLELILSQVTPILKNAMGNMGANFHFFVFDNSKMGKSKLFDVYSNSIIQVDLMSRKNQLLEVQFHTPLDSMHIPRKCPNGQNAHISWSYCPWSGKKL